MTTMDDLTAFITARLAEDEAAAEVIREGGFPAPTWITEPSRSGTWMVLHEPDDATPIGYISAGRREHEHVARHDPARALREVSLGRVILAEHGHSPHWQPGDNLLDCQYRKWPCTTLRALAAIWSDHPDYRNEWAPSEAS